MKTRKHRLRHGLSYGVDAGEYKADTQSDPNYVYLLKDGVVFARQAKQSAGKIFRQGTSLDYNGYDAYPLEYYDKDAGEWIVFDSNAPAGGILSQLARLVRAAKV